MVYNEQVQNLLDAAKTALRKGSYSRALEKLSDLETHVILQHIELPTETNELYIRACRMAARQELPRAIKRARRHVKKGKYVFAQLTLEVVDGYAQEGGVVLPDEFVDIRREVYRLGVPENVSFAQGRLEQGDYFYVKVALGNMETSATKLGIPVPESVQELRREFEKLNTHQSSSN